MLPIDLGIHLVYVIVSAGAVYFVNEPKENIFLLGACMFCVVHGLLCIVRDINNESDEECTKVQKVSETVADLLPLMCICIHFYKKSEKLSDYAYAHGFAAIVVVYDLFATFGNEDYQDGATEYLKVLTIAFCCISLLVSGFIDNNIFYMAIGLVVLLLKNGTLFLSALCIPGMNYVQALSDTIVIGAAVAVAGGYLDDFKVDIKALLGMGGETKDDKGKEGGEGGGDAPAEPAPAK